MCAAPRRRKECHHSEAHAPPPPPLVRGALSAPCRSEGPLKEAGWSGRVPWTARQAGRSCSHARVHCPISWWWVPGQLLASWKIASSPPSQTVASSLARRKGRRIRRQGRHLPSPRRSPPCPPAFQTRRSRLAAAGAPPPFVPGASPSPPPPASLLGGPLAPPATRPTQAGESERGSSSRGQRRCPCGRR